MASQQTILNLDENILKTEIKKGYQIRINFPSDFIYKWKSCLNKRVLYF